MQGSPASPLLALALLLALPHEALADPMLQLPWPTGETHQINGGFSYGTNPDLYSTHHGLDLYAIDFALPQGSSVSAVADGVAHRYGQRPDGSCCLDGYGLLVWVQHADGFVSLYAHLSSFAVEDGEAVHQGQLLGVSGGTPYWAPHLHVAVHHATGMFSGTAYLPEPMSNYTGFGDYGYNGCIDPAWDTCVAQPGGPESPPYTSTPPLATPYVQAGRVTSVGVDLSWDASPGATGYRVVRDGDVVGTRQATGFADRRLLPNTEHTYEVVAVNDWGASEPSEPLTVRTRSSGGLDYDGDGRADLALWRPGTGEWFVRRADAARTACAGGRCSFGASGDVPVPGDYDGDGRGDLALWRPSTGEWSIRGVNGLAPICAGCALGADGDVPVPGDYEGRGRTDLAVWRPSTGEWFIRGADGSTICAGGGPPGAGCNFGLDGDVPVPGDYDGDGRADLAVWRPSTGEWFIRSLDGFQTICDGCRLGAAGDLPVPGDYGGGGRTDLAVWRPGTGEWLIRAADGSGPICDGCRLGAAGDVPVPGDYDGAGRTDLALWRPSTGEWFIRSPEGGTICAGGPTPGAGCNFGLPGDLPVGARHT